jgi:hypothetical protein
MHYSKNWSLRKPHTLGRKNVPHQPLVEPCKMLPPSLLIKLGLSNYFVQALQRHVPEFSFSCEKFQSLSVEKIKGSVFFGPQTRQLFRFPQFDLALSDDEKAAWNALPIVATGFLGNEKPSNSGSLWKILQLLTRRSAAACHSRCIFSIHTWIPFMLAVTQHVMNTVCVLTRTSQRWKALPRANGVLPY